MVVAKAIKRFTLKPNRELHTLKVVRNRVKEPESDWRSSATRLEVWRDLTFAIRTAAIKYLSSFWQISFGSRVINKIY